MSIDDLFGVMRRRRLDVLILSDIANLRAATGVNCDNAWLVLARSGAKRSVALYTDFRYAAMVRRVAPQLAVRDLKRIDAVGRRFRGSVRVGYEASVPHARFQSYGRVFRKATFVDAAPALLALRAVKTADEIARIRKAEALACAIWEEARAAFRTGMTEREMARVIRHLMIERGEGEAFETIVCVGANAAECHHEPDDTVWNGRESVLVDMGVRLGGVCSDLTRNIVPKRSRPLYRKVYGIVRAANAAAIAAARPGMTARDLDRVARAYIRKAGFGRCFGHALGHGVGYEIHEEPVVSRRGTLRLKPGMVLTIEPGIYLEGNLGVRIEDLILITKTGCEVLSPTEK